MPLVKKKKQASLKTQCNSERIKKHSQQQQNGCGRLQIPQRFLYNIWLVNALCEWRLADVFWKHDPQYDVWKSQASILLSASCGTMLEPIIGQYKHRPSLFTQNSPFTHHRVLALLTDNITPCFHNYCIQPNQTVL